MAVPGSLKYLEALASAEWAYGVVTSAYLADMTVWITPTAADVHEMEYAYGDDTGEINGQTGPTTHTLESKEGSFARKFNASSEVLCAYLARLLGNVTSSGSMQVAQNEVQTLDWTGGATAGQFVLIYKDKTATINTATANLAAVQAAYDLLYGVNVVVASGSGTSYTLTFSGVNGAGLSWPQPRSIITVAFNAAGSVAIATITQGRAGGGYEHTIKWPSGCIQAPYSFAIIEGYACGATTGTYRLVKGMVVDSVDVNLQGKNFIELTLALKTAGVEEAVPSTVFASTGKAVTRLTGAMARLFIGENAVSGASADEIPAGDIRSVKITSSAGFTAADNVGGGTQVSEYLYGDAKPDLSVEVVIKGDKSHRLYQAFLDFEYGVLKHEFYLEIDPQATEDRTVRFYMHQCIFTAKPSSEGNETRLTLTFLPEWNDTDDGPATWVIVTDESAYNVAL